MTLAAAQANPLYGGRLSFGESESKERVKHGMSLQRARLFAVLLCAAVAVGLGVVFLTNPSGREAAETIAPASSVQTEPASSHEQKPEQEPVSVPVPNPTPESSPVIEPVQIPEPSAVQSSAPSPQAMLYDPDDVRRINLYDNTDKTYAGVGQWRHDEICQMLRGAEKTDPATLGAPLSTISTLEVTRESDLAKFIYRLYEHGFTVEGTAVENQPVATAYTLESPALWSLFCTELQQDFDAADAPGAYWLGLMSDAKIEKVTLQDVTTNQWRSYLPGNDGSGIVELLRGITVKTPFTQIDRSTFLSTLSPTDSMLVTVDFNNDIHYDIVVDQKNIEIFSSDMDYVLQYQLEGNCWLGDLRAYMAAYSTDDPEAINNPMTAKPVIYLYPERQTDVAVRLDLDGDLTYTYPAYHGGWEVTAQPDGTLTNKADGSTHYYLFWEGNARPEWEHDRGFVVKGAETEAFLRERLAFLGLTPREYNDFITYWVPRMRRKPYNLISFSGAQYDEIAGLTVSPPPDSMLRVHMVWMALDAPIKIEPQELKPFTRSGFTVVEWGGTEVFS